MSKANEIFVKCFKHDGSLHRVWRRSYLVENNENYFVIASKKAVVSEGNGRQWIAKEPAITIFPRTESRLVAITATTMMVITQNI